MCDMDEAEQAEYFLWVEAARARAALAKAVARSERSPGIGEIARSGAEPVEA